MRSKYSCTLYKSSLTNVSIYCAQYKCLGRCKGQGRLHQIEASWFRIDCTCRMKVILPFYLFIYIFYYFIFFIKWVSNVFILEVFRTYGINESWLLAIWGSPSHRHLSSRYYVCVYLYPTRKPKTTRKQILKYIVKIKIRKSFGGDTPRGYECGSPPPRILPFIAVNKFSMALNMLVINYNITFF